MRCLSCKRRFTQVFFTTNSVNAFGRGSAAVHTQLEQGADPLEIVHDLNNGRGNTNGMARYRNGKEISDRG